MAKSGMFDTAFLIASKYNLDKELFDILRKNHDVDLTQLKYILNQEVLNTTAYYDIFYNVKRIHINNIVSDFSSNLKLEYLNIFDNQIHGKTTIDISKNLYLKELHLLFTHLTTIDISNNVNLTHCKISNNYLKTLNTDNNTKLKELVVGFNQLEQLNLKNNILLSKIICYNNKLSSLDTSNNTHLTTIFCSNNYITELNMENNPNLKNLSCDYNPIKYLDLRYNKKIEELSYSSSVKEIILNKECELKLKNVKVVYV